ncbi:MAG TPA: HAMP domain-containing sensor histidine kinase, partial [Gemmatirosa sp.]|nr:HAMP domain-containing sensor histidine kinase [Gemmatirosa sp.]
MIKSSVLGRLTLALLLTALALTGVLAYQAQGAARSHRAVAERTLRSYAQVAAWEVANSTRHELLGVNHATFSPLARAEAGPDGRPVARARATLAQVREAVAAQERLCECVLAPHGVFRYDFRDGSLATDGRVLGAEDARRWVADTVRAIARAMPPTLAPSPVVVRSPQGYPRLLGYTASHSVQASTFGAAGGRAVVLVLTVRRTAEGAPVLAYGYAADPHAYVSAVTQRVLGHGGLLPPVLLAGAPLDSVLALTVADGAGREVYRSAPDVDARAMRYAATATLEPRYGGLRLHLAIRPGMADRLVIGGLPRSRLPLLVTLLAVTCGLAVVAAVQLRRQQELARVRTDFVSSVSHELRTPLAQIRLLAELLHLGRPATEAGRRRAARIIDQEARRLSYLVENILAFSRAERGTACVRPAPLDLAAEAAEVLELFGPLAAAAGARLELCARAGMLAHADAAAVRQVLLNFLDNATRYGPRGQLVRVGVEPTIMAGPAGAGGAAGVRVWVEDEGPGVPPSERQRLWEPYYRMERHAAVTGGGSGIGLAVVRDLVTRHGGRVWVEPGARPSAAGGGSAGGMRPDGVEVRVRPGGMGARFVAVFPASDAPQGTTSPAHCAAPPAGALARTPRPVPWGEAPD